MEKKLMKVFWIIIGLLILLLFYLVILSIKNEINSTPCDRAKDENTRDLSVNKRIYYERIYNNGL